MEDYAALRFGDAWFRRTCLPSGLVVHARVSAGSRVSREAGGIRLGGDRGGGPVAVAGQALWRQTDRALHQGLLPGYVTVEESSPVLRGRLRESVQLGARHGLPLPLEIRHDEFTVDIPENQILRAACARMLAVPRVDHESARMLRRLLREFGDVSELPRGGEVPSWTPAG